MINPEIIIEAIIKPFPFKLFLFIFFIEKIEMINPVNENKNAIIIKDKSKLPPRDKFNRIVLIKIVKKVKNPIIVMIKETIFKFSFI